MEIKVTPIKPTGNSCTVFIWVRSSNDYVIADAAFGPSDTIANLTAAVGREFPNWTAFCCTVDTVRVGAVND